MGGLYSFLVVLLRAVSLISALVYASVDRQSKGARVVESGSGFDNPCFEANPNSVAYLTKRNKKKRKKKERGTAFDQQALITLPARPSLWNFT
ncbi:hypothetical protein OUZ56_027951 [Daphnia magna]|uniref:Secreted protein n=1 Tax=Daphnia magna TaxID=35525 RepID=A0ABR0B2E9_9CRUS|nr:hypothetical protein OUZ56_027951 [Daphnia magna]